MLGAFKNSHQKFNMYINFVYNWIKRMKFIWRIEVRWFLANLKAATNKIKVPKISQNQVELELRYIKKSSSYWSYYHTLGHNRNKCLNIYM